jgi:hypothetical protein
MTSSAKPGQVATFHAFTVKYSGKAARVTTHVQLTQAYDPVNSAKPPMPLYETSALWDTGATRSVVTSATAAALGLVPVGRTQVHHAGGTSYSNTYLVNVFLPNNVGVVGVLVSECENIVDDFGAIIGMDIITQGDLAMTNVNNETCMSFRVPSIETIDYVVDANRIKFAGVQRNAPCPCGRKDETGKAVKYKHCHGKPE